MRIGWVIGLVIAGALVVPSTALGGGWATVELSSTPDGMRPGEPWNVELTVLQHGRTPLEGVQPAIVLTSGDDTRTVAARPTAEPGVYRARVTFPHAGRWRYVVDDGFSRRHDYPPVRIGGSAVAPPTRPPDVGPDLWTAVAAALAAGLLAGGAATLLHRRRGRRRAAPQGPSPARS